jgi:hypothetical protein
MRIRVKLRNPFADLRGAGGIRVLPAEGGAVVDGSAVVADTTDIEARLDAVESQLAGYSTQVIATCSGNVTFVTA